MEDLIPLLPLFFAGFTVGAWCVIVVRAARDEARTNRYLRESDYDPLTWAKREFPSRASETLPEDKVIRSIPWRGAK